MADREVYYSLSPSSRSKRDLDNSDTPESDVKRARLDMSTADDIDQKETFIKLLLPNYVAGLVIGKDGAEITQLMQSTSTNVKFSPGRELYPGTQDRVCVVMGLVNGIVSALSSMYNKIGESDRLKGDGTEVRQIKMLVSNIAAGMVIGKSGQTIKSIQQECSVRIQISSKEDSGSLPERILTIQGESEPMLAASRMVLERIINDPEADKWKRLLSYAAYTSSSQSHAAALIPSLTSSSSASSMNSASNSHLSDYSSLSSFFQMAQHPAYSNMANFQSMAAAAASTTAGTQSTHSFSQGGDSSSTNSLSQAMFTYMYAQSLMTNSGYFSRYTPAVVDGVNMTIPGATLATFEIAIPEVMISAVLGTGGKLMTDLIQTTGTHVKLSQKGDYIPGTYNRKLTITGPILGVQSAHLMVMQSIVREQEAFRKQGLI